VIGVGVKNSTSDLLIANCDEFIYYDDLVRGQPSASRARVAARGGAARQAARPEAAKAAAGRGEASRTEAAKGEAAKGVAAKNEAPKAVASKGDAAKAEAAKGDAVKTDAPRRRGAKGAASKAAARNGAAAAAELPETEAEAETAAAPLGWYPTIVEESPDADAPAAEGVPAGGASEAGASHESSPEERAQQALDLVVDTIEALAEERGEDEKIWGSMVKQTLKRRRPGFNETYYGYRSFNRLLEEARDRGLIELERDEKSGGYTVRSLA
jgi:hypothetical protein